LSERLGWLPSTDKQRAIALLKRFKLPVEPPRIGAERARELMGLDKKVLDGKLRLVLLRSLGKADVVSDYSGEAFAATMRTHFDAAA
jgi:3-dehydroquinate synthase